MADNYDKLENNIVITHLFEDLYGEIPDVYASAFNEEPWSSNWYDVPQFDKNAVWVAVCNDKVVGFIISFLSADIPYISVLAVLPEYRRLGIARDLVEMATDYWQKRNFNEIIVHLYNERKEALPFYEKASFEIIGYENDYIVLQKHI